MPFCEVAYLPFTTLPVYALSCLCCLKSFLFTAVPMFMILYACRVFSRRRVLPWLIARKNVFNVAA